MYCSFRVNGQATYIFNVKQRSKSEVEIVSMPDLSLNMTHFQQVQSEHESQVKVRCRVVAVEVRHLPLGSLTKFTVKLSMTNHVGRKYLSG